MTMVTRRANAGMRQEGTTTRTSRFIMVAAAMVLLCGVGGEAANFFWKVGGVRKIPVFPLVKEPTSPAILACEGREIGTADTPLANSSLWSKAGLYRYSMALKDLYDGQQSVVEPQNRYAESRAKNSKSVASSEQIGVCETRRMNLDSKLDFATAFCGCGSTRTAEKNCEGVKGFVEQTQCISQYAFDTSYCPTLKASLETADEIASSCTTPLSGTSHSLNLNLNNLLFPAGTYLPDTIDPLESPVAAFEGRTYYLAWMAADRFGRFADANKHCGVEDVELLPSWKNVMYLYGAEEGEDGLTPIISLSRRGHENFMLVVRDSRTTFEGRLYAQYEPALKHLENDFRPLQEGFSSPLVAATGAIDLYFDKFFKENYQLTDVSYNTTLIHPRILVVGTGAYGAGLGAVFADYLASKWDAPSQPWSPMLSVDAILFGAPRVGDAKFAESYRSKVNGRNILSKNNGANVLPCASQALCDKTHSAVTTGRLGTLESYASIGGTITIDTQKDSVFTGPNADPGWGNPKSRLDLVGHEVCVPKCWLVRNFCDDDPLDMCSPVTCPGLFAGNGN